MFFFNLFKGIRWDGGVSEKLVCGWKIRIGDGAGLVGTFRLVVIFR